MTPDEMKVLARVANRNAIEESPVVIDNSRGMQPINNEVGEAQTVADLDRRLDILEDIQDKGIQKVNELEARLGLVVAANDTPVKVLAEVVAQTKLDVADLKNLRDTVNLNPADVLTDVIKPTKLGSAADIIDEEFKLVGTIEPYSPAEGINSIHVRAFKDLGERPKNLINLDGLGGNGTVLTKLSGTALPIMGSIVVTSNSGLKDIDMTGKAFEDEADFPKLLLDPISAETVITINQANVISNYEFNALGALKGSRTISINSGSLGATLASTVGLATNTGSAGYVLAKNPDERHLLYYRNTNAGYTLVTSSSEFTDAPIGANIQCDVLFAGSSSFVALKYDGANYYYVAPAPISGLSGSKVLVEDRKSAAVAGVRPLYVVQPTPVSAGSLSPSTHQTVSLIKPSSNEYYRVGDSQKYVKVLANFGEVKPDISAVAGNTYFIDNNQIYFQEAEANKSRVRLETSHWVFNESTRKFICNLSATTQGSPANGYYNWDDNLIKIENGAVSYDQPKGEVIIYRFRNGISAKLTVPVTDPVTSTMAELLNTPLTVVKPGSQDLYIDVDMKLKNQDKAVVTKHVGLFYIAGEAGFTRANKLYTINSSGFCEGYTGLAFVQVEEDEPTFGLRVWYTCTGGAISPLPPNEYISTVTNRVFKVGAVAPTGNYDAAFAVSAASGALLAINKTRNQLLFSATQLDDSDLVRFSGEKLGNINKYQALGRISGGNKSTIGEIASLGGLEVMADIKTLYNNKHMRVISGSDYELVFVTQDLYKATASKTHQFYNSSLVLQVSSVIYGIDTAANNKLVKITSGYIFNDDASEEDLRAVKSDGTLSARILSDSDCSHFAWTDSDNQKKMYWIDFANDNRLQPVASNFGYEHHTKTAGKYNKAVFMMQKSLNAGIVVDDEEIAEDTSSYSMHVLDLAKGTYSALPVAAADKKYKFAASAFNANEFKSISANTQAVYWHRDAANNRPYLNRIVRTGAAPYTRYNTDSFGARSIATLVVNGKYFTDPTNALLYGVNGERVRTDANAANKHYIDYDGNLSKSGATSGDKVSTVTGNLFVVFADNDYRSRYFNNGRVVIVAPGTLIAVASKAPAQSSDHQFNGLKMWGKDETGMFSRWLNMTHEVARQANDAPVGESVELYTYDDMTTNSRALKYNSLVEFPEAANNDGTYTKGDNITVVVTNAGPTANKPGNSSGSVGDYFLDTTTGYLWKKTNATTWSDAVTDKFIYGGRLYEAKNTGNSAQTLASALNNFHLCANPRSIYRCTTAGPGTAANINFTTPNGAVVALVDSSAFVVNDAGLLYHNNKPVVTHEIEMVNAVYAIGGPVVTTAPNTGSGSLNNGGYQMALVGGVYSLYLDAAAAGGATASDTATVPGNYYYDTTNSKLLVKISASPNWQEVTNVEYAYVKVHNKASLYANNAGTWGDAGAGKHFMYSNKVYTSAANAVPTQYVGVVNQLIKRSDGKFFRIKTTGSTTNPVTVANGAFTVANNTGATLADITLVDYLTGTSAPSSGTGNDGNHHLNTTTGVLTVKSAGSWGNAATTANILYNNKLYIASTAGSAVVGVVSAVDATAISPNGTMYRVTAAGTATALDTATPTEVGASVELLSAYISREFDYSEVQQHYITREVKLYKLNSTLTVTDGVAATVVTPSQYEIVRLSTGNLKEVKSQATNVITWESDSVAYTIEDNETVFIKLDKSITKLKLKDGSYYQIKQSGNAANFILIVDGIVQDARAPRGTKIYTETGGCFVRTGYSAAQVAQRAAERAAGSSKPALTAKDAWAAM